MASSSEPEISPDVAEERLMMMRTAVMDQMRQINILEMDAAEHKLVLEALDPLDAGRKCFRMVGSVIVERTVSDVKPALRKNMEQVRSAPPPSAGRGGRPAAPTSLGACLHAPPASPRLSPARAPRGD